MYPRRDKTTFIGEVITELVNWAKPHALWAQVILFTGFGLSVVALIGIAFDHPAPAFVVFAIALFVGSGQGAFSVWLRDQERVEKADQRTLAAERQKERIAERGRQRDTVKAFETELTTFLEVWGRARSREPEPTQTDLKELTWHVEQFASRSDAHLDPIDRDWASRCRAIEIDLATMTSADIVFLLQQRRHILLEWLASSSFWLLT